MGLASAFYSFASFFISQSPTPLLARKRLCPLTRRFILPIDEIRGKLHMIDSTIASTEQISIQSKKSLQSTLNVNQIFPSSAHTKWNKPLVIGHRGSLYHALENTRRSFILAAQQGCDGIELDVFLLKCGTLVVFHGDDGSYTDRPGGLQRYCNQDGSILDYTAEEARELLKFNPFYEEFACGQNYILNDEKDVYVPTLREVLLDAKISGIIVKIELKGPGTALPVLHLVEELKMEDQCSFSSFYHTEIAAVRQMRPELLSDGSFRYKTGALFDQVPQDFIQVAQAVGASEIHLKYSTCTTDRVRAIHEANLGSMAWMRGPMGMSHDIENSFHDVGNEDESMYRILIATGVQSLCVNRPDQLVQFLKRNQDYFID